MFPELSVTSPELHQWMDFDQLSWRRFSCHRVTEVVNFAYRIVIILAPIGPECQRQQRSYTVPARVWIFISFKLVASLQVLVGGILAVLITIFLVETLISLVVILIGLCSLAADDPQVWWWGRASCFMIPSDYTHQQEQKGLYCIFFSGSLWSACHVSLVSHSSLRTLNASAAPPLSLSASPPKTSRHLEAWRQTIDLNLL